MIVLTSYKKFLKQLSLYKYRIAVLFGILLAWGCFSASAQAASNQLPNPDLFSTQNNVKLVVSKAFSGNSLDAPVSRVRIYSTVPDPQITIWGFGHCKGDGDTPVHTGNTDYTIFSTDSSERQVSSPQILYDRNDGVCPRYGVSYGSGTPYTRTLWGGTKSTIAGHEQYYVWIFQAEMTGVALNSFSLSINNGMLGYSADSGEKFALQDRYSGPSYSTFNLTFGSDCTVDSGGKNVELVWKDDDYMGGPNNGQPIYFRLYKAVDGQWSDITNTAWGQTTPTLGQDKVGRMGFRAEPQAKYLWAWTNVYRQNGIQFQLPFDSIWYETTCNSTKPAVSCNLLNANEIPGIVYEGDKITMKMRIANSGVRQIGGTLGSPDNITADREDPNFNFAQRADRIAVLTDPATWSSISQTQAPGLTKPFNTFRSPPGDPGIWVRGIMPNGIAAGSSIDTTIDFTASNIPADRAQTVQGITIVIHREYDSTFANSTGSCVRTITVKRRNNTPYLRATTNDVYAGATFKTGDTCSTRGDNAPIQTYSSYDNHISTGGEMHMFLMINKAVQLVLGRSINVYSDYKGLRDGAYLPTPGGANAKIRAVLGALYSGNPVGQARSAPAIGNTAGGGIDDGTFVKALFWRMHRRPPTQSEYNDKFNTLQTITNRNLNDKVARDNSRVDMMVGFLMNADNKSFSINRAEEAAQSLWEYVGGSGSEYGVFASGDISILEGLDFPGANGGYLTGVPLSNNMTIRALMFANGKWGDPSWNNFSLMYRTDDNAGGGWSGGQYGSKLCMTDYYSDLQSKYSFSATDVSTAVASSEASVYIRAANNAIIPPLTIPAGKRVVIVADGDVSISGNIMYANPSPNNIITKPSSFTLVVKGNVTVNPNVSIIAGTYIVQPRDDGSGGIFKTCQSGSLQDLKVGAGCYPNQLKVNGQVIAQDTRMTRALGTIGFMARDGGGDTANTDCPTVTWGIPAGSSGPPNGYPDTDYSYAGTDSTGGVQVAQFDHASQYYAMFGNSGGAAAVRNSTGRIVAGLVPGCAAEWFNFTPDVYFTGIGTDSDSGNGVGRAQSLVELPPIY